MSDAVAVVEETAGVPPPSPDRPRPRLRASGVVKSFDGVTALDGVDFELAGGEVLGLIGPNGSGKTTLMNCISGVHKVTGGRIELSGVDVTRRSSRARARAGLGRTFQNLKLFGELSVWENVAVGRTAAGRRRREGGELSELLDLVQLLEVADDVVRHLPYGYQRRVELARAIAGRPEVLLLDEPAAGLNDEETAELRELILRIREDLGCSVVVIDHDMDLVTKVSDRVQVLDEGKTLIEGDPTTVLSERIVIDAYLGSP